jgi:predicted nucleic-acid-binding Zn-ribbon protein
MKTNDKTCRNCGGTELLHKEVSANGGYGPALLPLGIFSFPKFHIQVCGACGLVEWFVPTRHLAEVKEKFANEA